MCNYNLDEWKIVPIDDEEYCARVSVRVTSDVGDRVVYDDIRIERFDENFIIWMDGARRDGKCKDWPFGSAEFQRIMFGSDIFEQLLIEDVDEELHRQLDSGELVLKK